TGVQGRGILICAQIPVIAEKHRESPIFSARFYSASHLKYNSLLLLNSAIVFDIFIEPPYLIF
ncbi:MAG: hypothetical protein ACUVTF_06755, partial [bacterium]